MQAHVSRSFLAKNCIFTHLSFEIETEKKFPLLLPSHNCIIITMFSFQGTWWNLLETPQSPHVTVPSKLNNAKTLKHFVLTLGRYSQNLVSTEVSLERR